MIFRSLFQKIGVRFPTEARDVSLIQSIQTVALGPTNFPNEWVHTVHIKHVGHIADRLLDSSVEVKDMWIVSSNQSFM